MADEDVILMFNLAIIQGSINFLRFKDNLNSPLVSTFAVFHVCDVIVCRIQSAH